jgi:glycolate oxidase iron-sulfur subunit
LTERGGFEALDACVHCGFCLQACPTFLATGDEADSPRGRIELMRALEAGELAADDPAVAVHLDRCLGCRGCEPVCPSGVGYGRGLEAARDLIARKRGLPPVARAALWALTTPGFSRVVYALARVLRATGLPGRLAGWGRFRFAMGMLAATRPEVGGGWRRSVEVGGGAPPDNLHHPPPSSTTSPVLLFRGCIMDGLFSHVHDATIRTLEVNGYAVREVPGQVCCGALHAHAGLRGDARGLARRNLAAFGPGEEPIVVNSAGCGAMLREYGHLLGDDLTPSRPLPGDGEEERAVRPAASFAARVRDVTELLAERGPRPGAPVDTRIAYDPPCHLLHAQRIAEPPHRVLAAIPVLRVTSTPDAAQCCGSAGLFTLVESEMSRAVLAPKLASLREAAPQVVATGNPGCLMQLGAGLSAAGIPARTRHPVELLDDSYGAAGYYA